MTLNELQKICEEATKSPWVIDTRDDNTDFIQHFRTGVLTDADAKFIAAARTYMPILIEIARVAALSVDYHGYDPDLRSKLESAAFI